MSSKKTKTGKGLRFRGKQIFVVGLIALVLAAGYYRWTMGALNPDAVSVSSTAEPSPESSDDGKDTETFWGGKDDDANDDKEEDKTEDKTEENNENVSDVQNQSDVNILSRSRQDRDKLRGETMDKWKEISSNKDASESAKKQAEDNIVKLTEYSENENTIETNVKAKGFDDCFAQVGESGVTLVVKGGSLDSASVAQLKDIIIAETGVAASQIKISAEQ